MARARPTRAAGWTRRLGTGGLVCALLLALLGGAPPSIETASPPAPADNPMDEPLRLLAEARRSYEGVKDYICLMVKRERINGQMGPENVIQMKFRKEPFSVGLHWLEPKSHSGQEAYFVSGQHDNKLRVKGAGVLGLLGFVTLDANDARVRASSKHPITEAGIGNLIGRYEQAWQHERTLGLSKVSIAEYQYNKRRCWRVETTHPPRPDGTFVYYRTVVYFDQEHKLPLRVECYDWPAKPGDPGTLVEMVSYAHLKLNVGLPDEVFQH